MRGLLVAAALFGSGTVTHAQGTYPAQAINLIVPFSAGSQPDILARATADGLASMLGRPVVVLNKEGASGVIAVAAVAAAAPSGYTLGFGPPRSVQHTTSSAQESWLYPG